MIASLNSVASKYFAAKSWGRRIDDAPELDDAAVAGAFDDAAVMHRDGWVDQVAAKGPKASEDSIFIRTRKPRVADDISD
jgi:hypothetical protein